MSGYSAPAFGALTTGFVPKLTSDVLLDITTQAQLLVDPNIDLSPTEPVGQLVGVLAGSIAEVWEVLQTLYNSINPNAAEGVFLYGIGSITGTVPKAATFSKCICNAVVQANAVISAGLIANVAGQPTNTWQLLGLCDANYNLLGPLVSPVNGTVLSLWQATTTGPVAAAAGQLTVVPSLPAGLSSITNPNSALLGSNKETDAAFRLRRDNELAAAGSESLDAIRAAVLEVSGITSCSVYENTSDVTDSSGRPPHSIEVVIWDVPTPGPASNSSVAQAIWNNKPGGIQMYSATGDTGTATDSQGGTHGIVFTRVTSVPVYVSLTTVGATSAAAVQASIVAAAANLKPGSSVVRLQLMSAPIPDGFSPVTGCTDVTAFTLGLTASPTGTSNLTFSIRQFPYVQTANVVVTLT